MSSKAIAIPDELQERLQVLAVAEGHEVEADVDFFLTTTQSSSQVARKH